MMIRFPVPVVPGESALRLPDSVVVRIGVIQFRYETGKRTMTFAVTLSNDIRAIVVCFAALACSGLLTSLSYHCGAAGRKVEPQLSEANPETRPRAVSRTTSEIRKNLPEAA